MQDEYNTPDDRPPREAVWPSAPASKDTYTISDLAREFQVTTRAIRFYESKGLLSPERSRGARIYSRRDRARLILILRGKRVGYKLDDIREYLDLYDADPTRLTQLKFVHERMTASIAELEQKKADIDEALQELEEMKAAVEERLRNRSDE